MTEQNTSILATVAERLQAIELPFAGELTAADVLADVRQATDGRDGLIVTLEFGMPIDDLRQELERAVSEALAPIAPAVSVSTVWRAPHVQPTNSQAMVEGVKNIIAVASGKGGVGKSTTTANLAVALAMAGAKVGVLDADIYGPSQAMMLGVGDQRPKMLQPNVMEPVPAVAGVGVISMGNLVTEDTPMVWRGPMVSGALQQLLRNTRWDGIDYLLVDMPPGTGDVQLTLAQTVPVSGAVIVTTPQDIALLDARKGIEMFRKVSIPVLGVVENMATHTCSQCGHTEAIFGEGGGARLAAHYQAEMLGQLPLKLNIRTQTDRGTPPVAADPDAEESRRYRDIARRCAAQLWLMARAGEGAGPKIVTDDD